MRTILYLLTASIGLCTCMPSHTSNAMASTTIYNLDSTSWSKIGCIDLPVSIKPSDDWDEIEIDKERLGSISVIPIDGIFNGRGEVDEHLYSGKSIDSTARFFMRLPDVNGVKLIVYKYLNATDFDNYPAYCIYSIDANNNCIDKLVISMIMPGGNSWQRNFSYDSSNIIVINDVVKCWSSDDGSEDNPIVRYTRTDTYKYTLNETGHFIRYYDVCDGEIEIILLEDYSEASISKMYREKGVIKNHRREGVWQVSKVEKPKDYIEYVQKNELYSKGNIVVIQNTTSW